MPLRMQGATGSRGCRNPGLLHRSGSTPCCHSLQRPAFSPQARGALVGEAAPHGQPDDVSQQEHPTDSPQPVPTRPTTF